MIYCHVATIMLFLCRTKISFRSPFCNIVLKMKYHITIYRFTPEMTPRYMNFSVDGIKLADQSFKCDHTKCSIKLDQLRPKTSGVYKCEVSSDAPHFNLISGTSNMSVAGKIVKIRDACNSMWHELDNFILKCIYDATLNNFSNFQTWSTNNGSCAKLRFWWLYKCQLYIRPVISAIWSFMVYWWKKGIIVIPKLPRMNKVEITKCNWK